MGDEIVSRKNKDYPLNLCCYRTCYVSAKTLISIFEKKKKGISLLSRPSPQQNRGRCRTALVVHVCTYALLYCCTVYTCWAFPMVAERARKLQFTARMSR